MGAVNERVCLPLSVSLLSTLSSHRPSPFLLPSFPPYLSPPPACRFDPKLLFQLTCSDMVERFKLLLFLGLITLLNFGQHAKEEGGTAVFFGRQGERRIRKG